MAIVNIII